MKSRFAFCLALFLTICCMNTFGQSNEVVVLWPQGAPGALGTSPNDIPSMTCYPADPAKATGAAMVILPGGGYGFLAAHEGRDYAVWLNEQGINCFVLKYRLGPTYHHPCMLQDASRAVRLVRSRAADWKIDTHRVGIMGSSAGGHLASTLLTHFDAGDASASDVIEQQSSRPDLGILCYPVITMGQTNTNVGSQDNLLGKNAPPELLASLSNEKNVTSNTPPCFMFHTSDDRSVPVSNSLLFADALSRAKVPYDLHIYQHGQHGMGLGGPHGGEHLDQALMHPWTVDCLHFLKEKGFSTRK